MGKLLQIRVSAWTYREEDVVRAWPALTALAWPRPQYPDEKRGVLELVTALENGRSKTGPKPSPRAFGKASGAPPPSKRIWRKRFSSGNRARPTS